MMRQILLYIVLIFSISANAQDKANITGRYPVYDSVKLASLSTGSSTDSVVVIKDGFPRRVARASIIDWVVGETPSGTVNGTNKAFTLAYTPITNKEVLYLNGIRQKRGTDYTITGASVTFTIAPETTDELLADYLK